MAAIRPNPTLSDDLISQILVRVTVKSLLQFQSVSKTWLSLIKDPAFVKAQLLHAITIETDDTLIINPWTPKSYTETQTQRQRVNTFSLLHVDSCQIVADLKFPDPRGEVEFYDILGSANGIVCVAVQFNIWTTDIYLWNPAIRQSKLIPSLFDTSDNILRVRGLGFGYDRVDHDFKVVTFVAVEGLSFRIEVYSDNQNAWRNVNIHGPTDDQNARRNVNIPGPIDDAVSYGFHVCINGFLCGIGNHGMMAFDLNREVLNCAIKLPVIDDAHAQHLLNCAIKLPVINDYADNVDYDDNDDELNRLIEFNNSVAVIMMMDSNKKINMWTLDDVACLRGGGVEASWTPMFSIDLGKSANRLMNGYFSNGNLLLLLDIIDVYTWISCNVDKKEAKIAPPLVDMADHLYDCGIYKYTESLVSLAGFRHVNYNVGENDN